MLSAMEKYIIETGMKINTEECLNILEEVLLLWIKNYCPIKFIFIKDSASAHAWVKTVHTFFMIEYHFLSRKSLMLITVRPP